MKVRAYYYVHTWEVPILVNVRVHTKFDALGEVQGTSLDYAERRTQTPQLIFWRDEVEKPARLGVVSISSEEAYRIDHIDPPYNLTVTAYVVALSADEIATLGLMVPA